MSAIIDQLYREDSLDPSLSNPKCHKHICHFGVTEAIVAGSVLEAAIGTTAATALTTAAIGAAGGAAISGITGGNPLTGALTGGITGGLGSLGGALGGDLLGSATAGAGLGGAAGGALGAAVTGGNPLTSAIMGGAGSALATGLSSMGTSTDPTAGVSGPADISTSAPNPAPVTSEDLPPVGGSGALSQSDLNSIAQTDPSLAAIASDPSSAAGTGGASTAGSAGGSSDNSPGILTQLKNSIFGSSTPTYTMSTDANGNPVYTPNNASGGSSGALPSGSSTQISVPGGGATGNISGAASSSSPITLGSVLGKIANNPVALLQLAGTAYTAANQPSLPSLSQQQASTQGASFNTPLPSYQFNSTRNPIANYYTYGYSPQPAQIQNTLTPTTPMAEGGRVGIKKFALGGIGSAKVRSPSIRIPHASVMPRKNPGGGMAVLGAIAKLKAAGAPPPMAAPAGLPAIGGGAPPMDPGTGAGALPMARGGKPRSIIQTFSRDGQVDGGTRAPGQKDNVPAMLSEDEYVIPADVTAHLGDGSSKSGGSVLDKFVANVRAQKAVKGQPPKAKPPEQYLPQRRKK